MMHSHREGGTIEDSPQTAAERRGSKPARLSDAAGAVRIRLLGTFEVSTESRPVPKRWALGGYRSLRGSRAGDIAAYRAALDLYAGDLLPGDRYEDWAESKRQELRRTYSTLLTELAALYEGRGDHGLAIEALLKAVSSEPTHEEAHAGLMRLYASTGQRYQALRLYEQLQETLRRELAAAPHEIARRIRQEILAGHVPIGEPSPVGPPPAKPSEAGRHNLSGSLTGFVGREREKEGVKRLLGTARVLDCLDGLAATAADRGRVERAVRLWGAIEARASPAATRSTVATATIT